VQNIIIDKPYRFVPPAMSAFWTTVFRPIVPRYLKKHHGVESYELLGAERLRASAAAGRGILLAPNHCRPCDPFVVGMLADRALRPAYIMASWHTFQLGRLQAFLLRRLGIFSVYREGMDRESLKLAIQLLTEAKHPLVVFPEGVVSRTNDRLGNLMDGPAFMARIAAKRRAGLKPAGQVVIHPVALRYFFRGDLDATLAPVLEEVERRLSWRPRTNASVLNRIAKIGEALLTLKEIEYLGGPQTGGLEKRLKSLIDFLLVPLEDEWLKGDHDGGVVSRVKDLRAVILPDMVNGDILEAERARRWEQLADTYLAQQVHFYPPDYFGAKPTPEQLLETVERFEEDLTDVARVHRPLHVVVEIGEAIEVSPARDRNAETDPVMDRLRGDLTAMLERSKERRPKGAVAP
jgi:1-acyl-sn-glycerol-3-phosphate acyltransferase